MKGRCLCGAVEFTARGVDPAAHCCHCSMCRTWSGGPALSVEAKAVTFGDEAAIARYQSSDWAERGFCRHCGTNLFYHLKQPGRYIMWSGPFEDQSQFKLAGEIFIDEKPPGYDLAGDHERLTAAETMASFAAPPPSE